MVLTFFAFYVSNKLYYLWILPWSGFSQNLHSVQYFLLYMFKQFTALMYVYLDLF